MDLRWNVHPQITQIVLMNLRNLWGSAGTTLAGTFLVR